MRLNASAERVRQKYFKHKYLLKNLKCLKEFLENAGVTLKNKIFLQFCSVWRTDIHAQLDR